MEARHILLDLYGRLPELVHAAVRDLSPEQLRERPTPNANPVGWLVWHLTRVQDHHISDVMGVDQLWVGDDWAARFALPPDPTDTGYGHSPEQVAAVRPDSWHSLVDYYTAVAERTTTLLRGSTPGDLDRVVDEGWDPPVTLGVRLVSVAEDDLQHVGQAAYLRGLLLR